MIITNSTFKVMTLGSWKFVVPLFVKKKVYCGSVTCDWTHHYNLCFCKFMCNIISIISYTALRWLSEAWSCVYFCSIWKVCVFLWLAVSRVYHLSCFLRLFPFNTGMYNLSLTSNTFSWTLSNFFWRLIVSICTEWC